MIYKVISAAAVAYALVSYLYGRADYAAVGPYQFDTAWLEAAIPVLAGILYPLLSKFVPGWPAIAKIVQWVLPKPDGDGGFLDLLLELLDAVTEMEEMALMSGNTEVAEQCGNMRKALLNQIKTAGESE